MTEKDWQGGVDQPEFETQQSPQGADGPHQNTAFGQAGPVGQSHGGPSGPAGEPGRMGSSLQPATAGGYGPIGEVRSTGLMILLALLTCGIWQFVWTYQTSEEMKRHTGDGLGGVLSLVLLFFFSPIILFLLPNDVEKMYHRAGRRSPVSAVTGCWLFLPIAGPIVWFVQVNDAINQYWLSLGAQPK